MTETQITLTTIAAAFAASLAWPSIHAVALELWCIAYGIFL
jgi:hypothetical protein